MPRPVRIGGISMSREDFFKNVLAPGWKTYAVFEKDLTYYVGSSRFGKFFDDSLFITRSCYYIGTKQGCKNENKTCKYSHEAPDGVLCKASYHLAPEKERQAEKHQAYVALYVQMKRQVAKYRLKGVQIPTNTTFEEIIKDVPFGRLLSVETPDGIFTEAATRKENKRKLISSAGITSEDEIAELMKLCPYDLEIALSTRTTPEANAAGGGSTIPATVPKKDSGTPYADKVKGTTLVKVLKKDGETPYADKVAGKSTSALIKALTTVEEVPLLTTVEGVPLLTYVASNIDAMKKSLSTLESETTAFTAQLASATAPSSGRVTNPDCPAVKTAEMIADAYRWQMGNARHYHAEMMKIMSLVMTEHATTSKLETVHYGLATNCRNAFDQGVANAKKNFAVMQKFLKMVEEMSCEDLSKEIGKISAEVAKTSSGRAPPALSATFGGTNGKDWDDIVPR